MVHEILLSFNIIDPDIAFEAQHDKWKRLASHSGACRFFGRDMETDVIIGVTNKLQSSLD